MSGVCECICFSVFLCVCVCVHVVCVHVLCVCSCGGLFMCLCSCGVCLSSWCVCVCSRVVCVCTLRSAEFSTTPRPSIAHPTKHILDPIPQSARSQFALKFPVVTHKRTKHADENFMKWKQKLGEVKRGRCAAMKNSVVMGEMPNMIIS